MWVATYLRTHGHRALATEVIDEAIAWFRLRPLDSEEERFGLARALYLAERWDEALPLFEELAEEHSQDVDYLAWLGALAARRGDREEALRISEELRLCDRQRCTGFLEPGMPTVNRAWIAALLGDREEAVTLLRQVLGVSYADYAWVHYDIFSEPLRDYPPFQEFMRPKG